MSSDHTPSPASQPRPATPRPRSPVPEYVAGALLLAEACVLLGLLGYWGWYHWQLQAVAWLQWLATVVILRASRGWFVVFGPVLFYELVCTSRRLRYFLFRCLYAAVLLLLLGWLYAVWWIERPHTGTVEARQMAAFAESFFGVFMVVQLTVVLLFTPAYIAGAVALEKERRTLEFILATDLGRREIVLGKLASRFLNLTVLVLTGLPVLSFLQFLGGIDPNLLLAGFAFSGLSMVGLAGLSIYNSVQAHRARDAIALTYVVAAVYIILSGFAQIAAGTFGYGSFELLMWGDQPITVKDLTDWFAAGNLASVVVQLSMSISRRLPLHEVLPELLRNYAIFHVGLGAGLALLATARLRAVALRETYGKAQRLPLLTRWLGRPRVGTFPMIWKEVLTEPGLRLNWLGKLVVLALVVASFVPVGFIVYEFLKQLANPQVMSQARFRWGDPWYILGVSMNIWVRIIGTMVGCLMLLAVTVRAAGSVSGERDRRTLDELLTTPLSSAAIIWSKWLGSVLSVRWAWLWLLQIWLLGMAAGGLNPLAVPVLVLTWLVYAAVAAGIGLWFSTVCRTTLRATLWSVLTTVFVGGGHWVLMLLLVYIPLMVSGVYGRDLEWMFELEFGQTPPLVMGLFAFWDGDFENYNFRPDSEQTVLLACSLLGLVTWLVAGILLNFGVQAAFTKAANRLPFRRRRPLPAARAVSLQTPVNVLAVGEEEAAS